MQQLSASSSERLDRLENSPYSAEVDLVTIDRALHEYPVLEFSFQVDEEAETVSFSERGNVTLNVAQTAVERTGEKALIWKGTVLHEDAQPFETYSSEEAPGVGDAILVQRQDGAVTGTISFEGVTYSIRHIEQQYHALVKDDASSYRGHEKQSSPFHAGGNGTRENVPQEMQNDLSEAENAATSLTSGTYIVRLDAEEHSDTMTITVVK